MFTPITSHVDAAKARLIEQYKEKTNLLNLITSLISPIQDIESALGTLNTDRSLMTAEGVNLDLLGTILGLARTPGDSDDKYRAKLIAQTKINTSQGQPEFAIQVYQLFTGAPLVLLTEGESGDVILESEYVPADQAEVDLLLSIIEDVLPAGIRCAGLVAFDPTEAFAYDGSLPGLGYGDAGIPTVGGKYPILFQRNTDFAYAGSDPKGAGYGSSFDPITGGRYVSV